MAEHVPGRRKVAKMLTDWSGERVSQHAARKIMEQLNLAKGEHTGRVKSLNRIDDISDTPLDRRLASKGQSIQTLQQLLDAAEVDDKEWCVTNWKANSWEQATKIREQLQKITLYQVKATLEKRIEAAYRPAEPTRSSSLICKWGLRGKTGISTSIQCTIEGPWMRWWG